MRAAWVHSIRQLVYRSVSQRFTCAARPKPTRLCGYRRVCSPSLVTFVPASVWKSAFRFPSSTCLFGLSLLIIQTPVQTRSLTDFHSFLMRKRKLYALALGAPFDHSKPTCAVV